MSDRLTCLVPGCKHTRGLHPGEEPSLEWICADHWRLVPRRMRVALFRSRRRHRRAEAGAIGGTALLVTAVRAALARARLWRRIRRAAIERSVGL